MFKSFGLTAGLLLIALTACGAAPAAQSTASASGAAAAPSKPASAAAAASGQQAPEKKHLEVARSAPGGTFMPVLIAQEAGYFASHGLDVTLQMIAPPIANTGLVSGTLDIYQGASSVVTAILGGADLIYVAAAVDRNTQKLIGKPGLTTVESLRGKTVSTIAAGAFGEIALRWTAKKAGLVVGKDVTPIFHPAAEAALATFLAGNSDATLISPPYSLQAQQRGNPVIVDYYQEGLRIVGPGTAVTRDFMRKNPNTLKAFLMGYLDGLKRALDEPAYAKQIDMKYAKLDADLAEADYQEVLRQWNKNMVVIPEGIQSTLDASEDPKARTTKPSDLFDNSLIDAVNRDYASRLFPNDFK